MLKEVTVTQSDSNVATHWPPYEVSMISWPLSFIEAKFCGSVHYLADSAYVKALSWQVAAETAHKKLSPPIHIDARLSLCTWVAFDCRILLVSLKRNRSLLMLNVTWPWYRLLHLVITLRAIASTIHCATIHIWNGVHWTSLSPQ